METELSPAAVTSGVSVRRGSSVVAVTASLVVGPSNNRPGLQPHDHVDVVPLHGHHDDRHLVAVPDAPAHVEAGHAGQHQVEHDDVRTQGAEVFQSLLTRSRREDVMALVPQRQLDGVTDIRVVFDNKDSRHLDSVGRPSSATASQKSPSRELLQKGHRGSGGAGDPTRSGGAAGKPLVILS
jgi:hypothetical protein